MNGIHQNELDILNKLINYQISSNSIPVDENLSQYIYNSIKDLGIVEKCRISLKNAKKPIGDIVVPECETCEYFDTYIPNCTKVNLPNTTVLSISTKTAEYGFIALKLNESCSETIMQAFQNFATLIAINIENYLHKQQIENQYNDLLNYKKQLEKVVQERTEELATRNTELVRLYEISKNNELRLSSIFRAAPACIGVVKNRILLDVNNYMCELLGYKNEELVGHSARILYPNEEEFLYVGEEKYRQILNYGKGTVETKWVKKSGEIIDIILSSTPIDLNNMSEGTTFTAVDVTPLKRAINQSNNALRKAAEEQEKFKNVFDYSVFPIAIADNNGKMLSFNSSFIDSFGYTIDDIPDIKTWFETVYDDLNYKEYVEKEWAELTATAIQKSEPTSLRSYNIKCKDGSVKVAEVTSLYLRDINFAMFHDITEEVRNAEVIKSTIAELQESKSNLQALIENTTESIWAIDKNHHLMYVNQVFRNDFEQAYGIKLEVGKNLIDTMQGEMKDLWLGYYSRAFSGERFIIEDEIQTQNGPQYIQVSVNPIYMNHEIIGVSFFGKNITEKKLREIEIIEAKQQVEERELLLNEMGHIAKIGGWKLDLLTNKLTWTKQVHNIHEVPYDYEPNVEEGINFYFGESKEIIAKLVQNAIEKGETFDHDLELLTATGKIIQVRALGKVKYNEKGEPVSIFGAFQEITERKNIENELLLAKQKAEEREKQFKNIFENAADAIFIADINTGVILDVNKKGIELMNTTKENIVGLHQSQLHPPVIEDYSKDTFHQHKLEVEREMSSSTIENELLTSDGSKIPIEILASKIDYQGKNCIMGIFRDISERKKAQKEISYKNKYLNLLLNIASEHINVPIHNTFESINRSMEEIGLFVGADRVYIFDYDWEKNTCSNTYEWCRPGISPQIDELQNVSNELLDWWPKKHKNKEIIYIDAIENLPEDDGVRQVIEPQGIKSLIALPLINNNDCIGFVGFDYVQDYHSYSEQEKFLLEFFAHILVNIQNRIDIHKNLLEAKEKAEESDRLKTAFLLNLSHEIRTPMNGILGFLNLLEEPNLSRDEIEQYVQIVNHGSERLIATINDIVEMSRIQANEVKVSKEMTNLRTIIKSHHTLFKDQIRVLGLEFILNESLPNNLSLIETDVAKLDSILLRLIQNAVKFTKQGSVEIGSYAENNEVVFYVKDTGKGIAREHFEDIFKPFYQVDTNLSREHEGSGLGLSIAKAYTELLGGRIWLESEIDVCSKFYFSLPIESSNN